MAVMPEPCGRRTNICCIFVGSFVAAALRCGTDVLFNRPGPGFAGRNPNSNGLNGFSLGCIAVVAIFGDGMCVALLLTFDQMFAPHC